ncbi:MAG: DUF1292 domain-containing protein [Eubacteriales bacterium]|nr:DUF1292 domain-containing protein [Eubacteriales bacterium]
MAAKIQFIPEGTDSPVDFYVLDETRLAGRQYLLVTDSPEGDGEALILRARPETASAEDTAEDPEGSMYEIVEEERELSAVLLLMRESLEDLGIEIDF